MIDYFVDFDSEMNLQIAKASKDFEKLEKRVWSDRGITNKLSVYEGWILSVILYTSDLDNILLSH